MSDDSCENSTDREFDDYFRKEEPAALIPRLENVLERLDGDEQELAVAGEIVNYVITQLEAIDEDTAGDSEAGLKDRQEERYKTPNESAAASETLEPVGRVEAETFETECSRGVVKFGAGDSLEELPEGTPLFTADQFLDLIDDRIAHCKREQKWCIEKGYENTAQFFADRWDELENLRRKIEFTQNGGSE